MVHPSDLSIESWLPHMRLRRMRAGETLIRQGDRVDSIYYLLDGQLELPKLHYVGDEARPRREGHRRTDPRPWRHSRPRRQPDLRGAGIRAFRPLFLLPMSKNPLTRLLRFLFFAVVVRAVILVALGLTVRNRERLPKDGPAVLAGNHNSNLDALAMMSLMPLRLLSKLRPVAAMDYFYSSKLRGWFADNIIGIIPVKRGSGKEGGNPL